MVAVVLDKAPVGSFGHPGGAGFALPAGGDLYHENLWIMVWKQVSPA
jgi:hypothetical protein